MLSFLFLAFAAYAQPVAYGRNGPFYGTGTPVSAPPVYPVRRVGPAAAAGPSNFDLRQANRAVRAADVKYQGKNLLYNAPWQFLFPTIVDPSLSSTVFAGLSRFASTAKAASAQIDEDRMQAEISHYRALHPELTRDDRDALDDLKIQRDAFRNSKKKNVIQTIPNVGLIPSTNGGVSTFYERRAHEDWLQLAQNHLVDARQDFQEDRNKGNFVGLRNARDDVEQADQRRDADTFDLLGNSFHGAVLGLGAVLRKKASSTTLDIGYRKRRAAQDDFAKDPSEANRLNLRLANLYIKAVEQEDDSNKDEILFSTRAPVPTTLRIASFLFNNQNAQDEQAAWAQYERLKRKILLRERAQSMQDSGASPVAQQMLGLSMYGPKNVRHPDPATTVAN